MREIKFRVWNNDGYISLSEAMYDFEVVGTQTNKSEIEPWDDGVVIEQYIGLKDKNSKEIYEGDIVTQGIYWDIYKKDIVYFEVFYWDFDVGFFMKDREGKFSQIYNCEVVGNIHENPELLEPKKDN